MAKTDLSVKFRTLESEQAPILMQARYLNNKLSDVTKNIPVTVLQDLEKEEAIRTMDIAELVEKE